MNSEGHTAGPWTVEKPNQRQSPNLWIIAPTNSGVCKIEPCDYDDGKGERLTAEDLANARLIAAAPDLLAALEDCNTFLDDLTKPDAKASGPAIIASYANAIALNMKVGKILSKARPKAEGGAE